jgi:lipopolysaccharide/colanic/teichoic acid biosynthesis glycosyltransferase
MRKRPGDSYCQDETRGNVPTEMSTTSRHPLSLDKVDIDAEHARFVNGRRLFPRRDTRNAIPFLRPSGGGSARSDLVEVSAALKRALDVLLVVAAAPLWIPLYAAVAFAILAFDGAPVHYRDPRVGLRGQPLHLLKFRSMCIGADQQLVALISRSPAALDEYTRFQKLKKDPRVTRIGRFIRRYSIDELPQLLHVLSGELSLVGPRPLTRPEIEQAYRHRAGELLSVRPGLTGLWQSSGRSDLTLEERARLDLAYVANHSIGTDVRILVATLLHVFKGNGV